MVQLVMETSLCYFLFLFYMWKVKIEAPAFTAPKDLFEADAVILEEHLKELATAGDHVTHGVATFRLEELLSTHKQLSKVTSFFPTNLMQSVVCTDFYS